MAQAMDAVAAVAEEVSHGTEIYNLGDAERDRHSDCQRAGLVAERFDGSQGRATA